MPDEGQDTTFPLAPGPLPGLPWPAGDFNLFTELLFSSFPIYKREIIIPLQRKQENVSKWPNKYLLKI